MHRVRCCAPCRGPLRSPSAMGSYTPQTPCAPRAAKHPLRVCSAPRSLKYPRRKEVPPIDFCHFPVSIIKRSEGRSAVAAAAYRSGTKLTNEWDGLTHDYTRKGGVVHAEIMLPAHAPPEFADRSTLWNSVEQIEKARDSQLAREIEAALPRELSGEQQLALVRAYVKDNFVDKGMCADFAIHDKGTGNPHVHIMLTLRPLKENGQWGAKCRKANVNALYEKFKKDNPDAGSNPFSRWQQKRAIKKEYAAAKAGKNTASTTASASKGAGKATGKAAQGAKNITERVTEFCTTHSKTILFVLIAGLLFMILSGMFSSCSAMFQGGTQIILGTSFTAKEEDIIGADNDYKALEAALRNKINNIERTHSGYDEYRYDLDEINHNPYELAAYLTVKFEDYTRDEVQATLQWLFEQQYELTLTEVVEIRTRTTSSTDPETGETTTEEEDYEYYILNVKLRNKGLNSVISNSGLSEDDMERYRILLQTRGNRPDIFGNDIYATPGGEYTDYDIPGEALTDTRFANMIREAEKYLGYPYVWGGSSPSTSFDCSGFVSYVINHCGNGWSVGRLTANGLMGVCDIIPKSSAKPGDLIFFQGTYDTSGASHVGIYVGNGMMIHCGNPISYASIESNYWQQHFYCFGRIRN